ncbi:conserved membrane hypothetical protein [Parafrankia sp. Ea1.12]|uniref:NACHT domain-containing protein n=1 Tax=Parafrankia sp. Ea1.12 TaxID=573499 RepID=UPI000DA5198C|nr:NACHT domain-containing protein [Parafrankia sp. Ea1.12]SQD95119.1 conserved membrane hypothetical protein [Parafrankia sp. Ea1.12]
MSISGGRGEAQRPFWLIAGGAAVAVGWAAGLAGQGGWAAVLIAVGVLLPVAAFLADRAFARAGGLDIERVADRLADLVRDQWDTEATRRGVGGPPLEVFWQAADADLVHSWPKLRQEAVDGRNGPVSGTPGSGPGGLAGSGALLAAYDRSPCGRLVVLGEPGAGKTVLLVRFVLDLIGRRQAGEPVPLLVPLASWIPDWQSLYGWLEDQILLEYPHLSAVDAATGDTRAGALLRAGLILPVLDGLDEIRAGGTDQALASINDELPGDIGLVLSCRTDEFRAAVRPDPDQRPIHLDGAAGIHVLPLTSTAIRGYLLAGAGSDGPLRWAPALTALADPTSSVAQALTTPLTAFLASTAYNPRPWESSLGLPSPTDLCALPTAAAVEQHLLAGFIPAAYRPHPHQPTRWTIKQATRYLAFLGHHLEHRLHTTSLAWWEIPGATPGTYRILTVGITGGLATGLTITLTAGVVAGPTAARTAALTFGLPFGLAAGLAAGLAFVLAGGLGYAPPARTALRLPRGPVLLSGLAAWLVVGLPIGLTDGPPAGLTVGLMCGLTVGLVGWVGLDAPVNTQSSVEPRYTLSQDRASALVNGLAFTLAGGLAVGLAFVLLVGFMAGLAIVPPFMIAIALALGLAAGLSGGLAIGLASAWGRLGLARPWLAARGQQPLRLVTFLEDAHARGVLCRAGAVWEFRHADLQRYLAGPP